MDPFERLVQLIKKWNRKINITGLKDEASIKRELIEDSLKPLEFKLLYSPVMDAGCGAGFPTLPLAIKATEVQFISVDSNRKKINFLRYAIRELGITNVKPVWGRLEEQTELLDSFNTVLSKAFMPPERAVEFLYPFLKQGGKLIVYTTSNSLDGGVLQRAQEFYAKVEVLPYTISDSSQRALLVCTK
ncbi:16S rRNA (guanine527-N7)-methyltransferase [Thermosulfidibacter takaii ABI70S6]|uniref:Ribosomal RNA small subunit methyltransferase G n=1 Tax=Thermosulfidibacter takaii (strain DSM 17441 / JCM 13301 / NBRC 103674 / ABI70S6) TaxID=1298851 RepID=A0A0S3QRM8_THET7|nr:16S rRNA (guanine(527)-N(7))-methyltransferase RsmG [Thermosulfidibacter takaii]BAT70929.1 16S rRNA (guanine527-N7)-methyltransferase [Thermosulfidibacter takaii ABI70S6]